jgi:TRAP-type C4-dicarboxylate transport system permease small subunit
MSTSTPPEERADAVMPLVEDEEVTISWHPEDWIGIALFWALSLIVFAQFVTRYILNDSLSWTEEVARYFLMVLTFVGAVTVTRKRTHIAVEVLESYLPGLGGRIVRFVVDVLTLAFIALLAWFSFTIVERMQIQRMTMIDASMTWVYVPISIAIFAMLARAVMSFISNARRGWRPRSGTELLIID